MPGSYLIYVYSERSVSLVPDLGVLTTNRLLLPLVFINKMPWTRGYFTTVEHAVLKPTDRLAQHCFWDAARKIYVDENLNTVPHQTHPCGDWALSSYRWLDDQISDALGIPRVPVDPEDLRRG